MWIKNIFIIILLLGCVGCSGKHFEPFTKKDMQLQATYTFVTAIDWAQTHRFNNYEPNIPESNILFGEDNPSDDKIDLLIPLAIVGHWLVTWYLDPAHRSKWQWAWIGIEGMAVINNHQKGVRINP